MGHGDFTFQIVATLSGAGVVSLLLILLISTEAKQRIHNPEPEVQNVNLWDLIKSKLSGFTHNIMRTNRSVERREREIWQQDTISSRGLKWVEEQSSDDDDRIRNPENDNDRIEDRIPDRTDHLEETHPVRHSHSRQHQLFLLELHKKAKSNRTSTLPEDTFNTATQTKRDLCYSGNQVLVVIGLTCLLNFAFVLVVVACVHYLNRVGSSCVDKHMSPGSMSRYDSMESEADEMDGGDTVSLKPLCPRCPPSHSMERLLFID